MNAGPLDLRITGITEATEIGSGGFGIVYRAVEEDLGRTVAVKVLSGNLDEAARYRFERERRAMGRLSGHPNIVTIYRGGYTEAGNAYLVMEFLDRGSLADRLLSTGPLGWQEALKFGVQLSGALETSHRAGVLHRDIKPANILMSNLGNAKLCDFGIARLQGAPETKSSVITASLSHAPPDIVSGQRPDARSDVYSLASTVFELVTGAPAFVRPTDESMLPILARIAQDPLPELPESQLPRPVFEVIQHAMAKEPEDRPATAAELGALFVGAQQRLGLPPTPIPIETASGDDDSGGGVGHIPYPDTPSGPLPAPSSSSPHHPTTGQTPGPTTSGDVPASAAGRAQQSAPTIVTAPSVADPVHTSGPVEPARSQPIADATAISNRHDPNTWGPPTPSAGRAPTAGAPDDTSGGGPGRVTDDPSGGDGGEDGWGAAAKRPFPLAIVAAIVAVLAVAGIGAALVLSDDDEEEPTAGVEASDVSDEDTDDDASDAVEVSDDASDADDAETNTTVGGQGPDDYASYEQITDETGSISINVPTEWVDRLTSVGTDGLPSLVASTRIEGGYIGTYDEPGMSVAVARSNANVDLDTVLDIYADPQCTSNGRTDAITPFEGRVERFVDCDATQTRLVHIVFDDPESGLIAVFRVQVLTDRDFIAADTMRSSLELKDNLPE